MFRSSNRSSLRNASLTTRRTAIAIAALAATAAIAIAGTLAISNVSSGYTYSTGGTADSFNYQWDADWNGSGHTEDSPVLQIDYLNSSGGVVISSSLGAFFGYTYYSPGTYYGGSGGTVSSKGYVNMSCPPHYQSQVTQARYRFHADLGASDSTTGVSATVDTPWRYVSYPW